MLRKRIKPANLADSTTVLLSAFGIHAGGGLVLLRALIRDLDPSLKISALDSRVKLDQYFPLPSGEVDYIPRSFVARILSLNKLAKLALAGDTLLCFNSLPPLRKSKGRVIVFVQAPHFVGTHRGIRYSLLTAIRLQVEIIWFKLGIKNSNEIWVQTRGMHEALRVRYPTITVKIVPLVDEELASKMSILPVLETKKSINDSEFAFFYPADAVGHKNHENLLRAWALLAKAGRTPKLFLTLQAAEMAWLWKRAALGGDDLNAIINLGWLTRAGVLQQLKNSSALIFPSLAETFGLPLLEARALGIPVVASERDFVRDVCAPAQTFDPESPRSIAMAILRFMDGSGPLTTQYYSAPDFVAELFL
ncbi:glycosyltransferase [Polynucleobacter sp. 39-46-10]|uniref:glycosyltransferase n=1 Tax=Polynucleobacter sp. 39-46-10 TaxID=1970428 RepID=UPI000BD61E6A|nr:glycosyltransferase [Polynucleobacter sp. 39-46-10]OZA76460.1 MAG: hypothetical protein B7X71_08315 [Polynucleobacter sp. 39-46-10]